MMRRKILDFSVLERCSLLRSKLIPVWSFQTGLLDGIMYIATPVFLMAKEIRRVVREATADERASQAEVRRQVEQEFPPLDPPREPSVRNRIAAAIRRARKDQGLTWEAVAEKASIPNPITVRDIEYGRDAKLSDLEAVAKALGLILELNEAP